MWITKYKKLLNSLDLSGFYVSKPTLILTVTDRLAVTLNHQLAELKSVEYADSVPPSVIFSFGGWLKKLWLQASTQVSERLLSAAQEQVLWEQIIQHYTHTPIASENAAHLASEALSFVHTWQLPWPFPPNFVSENSVSFQAWASLFQNVCSEQGWITSPELPHYLCNYFQKGILTYPAKIILVGFDELNPALQNLLTTLEALGTQLEYFMDVPMANSISRLELENVDTEILAMAHWAQKTLQENPSGSLIACIVPKLEQRRTEVLKAFNRVFADQPASFDLSAPSRLDEIPLIAIALKLLQLGDDRIELQNLGLLLRTPFVSGSGAERFARAQLDVHLRNLRTHLLSLETVLALAGEKDQPYYCPIWRDHVTNFRNQFSEDQSKENSPSVWAAKISDYLNLLGWPGEKPLNTDQKEIIETFQSVLSTLATLDAVCNTLHWQQVLSRLTRMTSQALFQRAPRWPFAPIQILGSLESIGCAFTQAWILGLTDESWPPSPQLNPFIPFELQTQFHIPHASAAREFTFSQQLTDQFCRLAPHVIFSSACYDGDVQQRPSRLLSAFPTTTLEKLGLEYPFGRDKIFQTEHCEYLVDADAPSVIPGERIRGGVSLFKLQAACPFRAFAEIRLQAKSLNSIRSHMNKKEQGSLVHHVLELVWKTLKNQKTLLHYSSENLSQLVEEKVDDAIEQFYAGEKNPLKKGFNRIERNRLIQLVISWLNLQEKSRPAFKIIALESTTQMELAGLRLQIRVDRIDEVEASRKRLLIDYKTGRAAREDWFGERLNEPQLPLYCVSSTMPISGVLFAQMKPGELLFKGIAEESIEISGVQSILADAWSDQETLWRSQLENLALQFSKGDARVDPKEGRDSCRFCDLQMLCRVKELG